MKRKGCAERHIESIRRRRLQSLTARYSIITQLPYSQTTTKIKPAEHIRRDAMSIHYYVLWNISRGYVESVVDLNQRAFYFCKPNNVSSNTEEPYYHYTQFYQSVVCLFFSWAILFYFSRFYPSNRIISIFTAPV